MRSCQFLQRNLAIKTSQTELNREVNNFSFAIIQFASKISEGMIIWFQAHRLH